MPRPPLIPLFLLLSLCFFSWPLRAQEPPATAPAIKVETRVVLVDVVVTDKQGHAVPGLRKDSFHVLEDGVAQSISWFDEHKSAAAAEVKLPPMPPNVFTNFPTTRDSDSVNILLLDLLNTTPAHQSLARQQVVKFLSQVPHGTRLAVFALGSQLRIVRGFTTDFSGLAAALDDKRLGVHPEVNRLMPTPGQTVSEGVTIEEMRRAQASPAAIDALSEFQRDQAAQRSGSRAELTMHAFQHIARYLSGIPARKNLIWFSESFPITFFPDARTTIPKNREQVQTTSDMLTAAQVAIYPVSALGLIGDPTFDVSLVTGTLRELNMRLGDSQIAMETIAEETGGRAFYNTNALDEAATEAISNGSHYYTLAYSPANNKNDGKFRRIQLSVPAGEYKLSYRRGYYADKPLRGPSAPDRATEDPLIPLIGWGMPNFDQILYKVQAEPKNPQPPPNAPRAGSNTELHPPLTRYDVLFAVALPDIALATDGKSLRHGHIEVMLMAFDSEGRILNIVKKRSQIKMDPQVYEATKKFGMQIHEEIDVPEGEVYLRTGIYDLNSGNCGTVGFPLNPATTIAPAK